MVRKVLVGLALCCCLGGAGYLAGCSEGIDSKTGEVVLYAFSYEVFRFPLRSQGGVTIAVPDSTLGFEAADSRRTSADPVPAGPSGVAHYYANLDMDNNGTTDEFIQYTGTYEIVNGKVIVDVAPEAQVQSAGGRVVDMENSIHMELTVEDPYHLNGDVTYMREGTEYTGTCEVQMYGINE